MSHHNAELEQERELVIELLAGHYAEDRLELEEYEERVEQAEAAVSEQELRALVVDLEPQEEAAGGDLMPAPAEERALARRGDVPTSTALVPASQVPERKSMVAIFSGPSRKGAWTAPRRLNVVALLGGADIDFREARLCHGVTEVNCKALLGGVHIIVPPELRVEVEGTGVLGAFEDRTHPGLYDELDTCSLRITGLALLGGVEIEQRLPGESKRVAKKRAKLAKKKKANDARKLLQ